MFSKDLQELIDAAVADGIITEKERETLHKRAQAEGVDVDELDMIIDARLVKLNHSGEGEAKIPGVPKKESAAKELSRLLREAQEKYERRLSNVDDSWYDGLATEVEETQIRYERDETIGTIIRNFHVPNDRDDVLDFLLLCKKSYMARADTAISRKEIGWTTDNRSMDTADMAYIEKGMELIGRAKAYYPQDSAIMTVVSEMEKWIKTL